jgi:hypothetical protein
MRPHAGDALSADWTLDAITSGQQVVSMFRNTEINSFFCSGADTVKSLNVTDIQSSVNYIGIYPSNVALTASNVAPSDYKIDIETVDSLGRPLVGTSATFTPATPPGTGYFLNAVMLQPVEQFDRQAFIVFRYSGSAPVSFRILVQVHIVP